MANWAWTLAQAEDLGSPALERFLTTLAGGISRGAIYALLALGFVIIFKATQVVNFAHGSIAAVGAFITAAFATVINFPGRFLTFLPEWLQWGLSAVVAVAATAVVGLIVERLTIRPMVGEPLFSIATITIGVDIMLRTVNDDWIGQGVRPLGDPWGTGSFNVAGVSLLHTEIVTVAATGALLLLLAWFFRSGTGVAMRAVAFDQEAAMAQGINVGRIFAMSWAIGAGLAAVAGIFVSLFPSPGVNNTTAFVVFRAFPAIILGGLDSIPGAVIGGFLVGIAEVTIGVYTAPYANVLGQGFGAVVPYILMLVVLLIKPYGLFGTEEIRRV